MVTSPPGPLSASRRGGTEGKVGEQRVRSYFSSMSCGRPAPEGKWSKSTSNFSSRVIPWGPTLSSRTRNGTLPSRLESSELLTYSRRLSGVSFIMFGWSSFTSLMNFGCNVSDTSYCCTALPANSETYSRRLSYQIRMSDGVEVAGPRITRDIPCLPSLSYQQQIVLAPAQLVEPTSAPGPCIQL